MRRTALRLAILLSMVFVSACATRVHSEHMQSVNFMQYQKFHWQAPPHNGPVRNPIIDSAILGQRVKNAVVQTLLNRGFKPVDSADQADFLVTYLTSTQQEVRGTGNTGFCVGFGRPFYDPFFSTAFCPSFPYDVRSYQEASLIIDVIDAGTHQLVWRGWTSTELNQHNYSREAVDDAVARILREFPPRG